MKILFLCVILCSLESVLSDDPGINYFSVIGPQTIRAEKDYLCAVTSHNSEKDVNLEIGITWDSNVLSKEVFVPKGQTKMVVFPTKKFTPRDYQIYVNQSATGYYQSSALGYLDKAYTATIQLEKPFYKPGDLVRFRIFAYNSRTVPYNFTSPQTVKIMDPSSNKMFDSKNAVFVGGIYENEFLLPSKVVLGIWTLSFETKQETIIAQFEVSEYTLPLFTTTLSIPPHVAPDAGSFIVSSSSKYTSGAPIAGVLKILCHYYNSGGFSLEATEHTTGETSFEISLEDDLQFSESSHNIYLECNAVYIDDLTQKTANAPVVSSIIHKNMYDILYSSNQNNIKPGLPFKFSLSVVKFDGTPGNQAARRKRDISDDIAVNFVFGNSSVGLVYKLDNMGNVKITIDVPENTTTMEINSSYGDATFYNMIDSINYKGQMEFLTITPRTADIKNNEIFEFDIETTEDTPCVYVQLFSKQLLRQTFRKNLDDKTVRVSLRIRFGLTPTFRLVAYYVSSSGQIIGDSIEIASREELSNSLELKLNKDEYKPGESLTLSVTSKLNSTVCFAAIDHRVSLLKSEGVIDKNTIFDQLDSYISTLPFVFGPGKGQIIRDKRSLDEAWYDLLFMTNALAPIPDYPIFYYDGELGNQQIKPKPGAVKEKKTSTKVRKNFAENFLWERVEITQGKEVDDHSNTGEVSINVTIPESITTWSLTGISFSHLSGIGISNTNFDVALPFFIQLNLPYSAKRGEGIVINILIFNYLNDTQDVDFVFEKKDDEFEVLELTKYKWIDSDNIFTQSLAVLPNSVSSLEIKIAAKVIGFVTINVKAVGNSAGDGIEEKMRIVPEGVPKYITNGTFIQLTEDSVVNKSLICDLPPNAVLDTVTVSATVVGDIIGNSLSNIDRLIQIPSGCGEQNMITLVPNIAAIIYLNKTNQLTSEMKATVLQNMQTGYQTELTYKLLDGSFSAFGESDGNGSTWLTAFVAKTFIQAKEFIPDVVETTVIDQALAFIVSKQQNDGSFVENGRVIHVDMQGAAGDGLALTCYLAIVLHSSLEDYPGYLTNLEDALDLIKTQLSVSSSTYELSICLYALKLHNYPNISSLATSFLALAIETSVDMHWENNAQPGSLSIEMTAYGLLYLQLIGDLSKSVKVLKWLISQQNSFGGYSSTQDTVVGLQAITTAAVSFVSNSTNLDLKLVPDVGPSYNTHVDEDNALTVQNFGFQFDARSLTVNANGTGFAVVQFTCNCYILENEKEPSFGITLSFVDESCDELLRYLICVNFIPSKENVQSNMVIVSVELPSGYHYDDEHIQNVNISLIVAEDQSTRVSVYINSLTSEQLCFRLNAIRAVEISDLALSTIEIVDFYDTSRKASISYELPELAPCQGRSESTTEKSDERIPGKLKLLED